MGGKADRIVEVPSPQVGSGGIHQLVVEVVLELEGFVVTVRGDQGSVADDTQDAADSMRGDGLPSCVGNENCVQEVGQFFAFLWRPRDCQAPGVHVVTEEGYFPGDVVLPFSWVDAWRAVGVVVWPAKHGVGSKDAGSYCSEKEGPHVGNDGVINKGGHAAFRVVGAGPPDAFVKQIR